MDDANEFFDKMSETVDDDDKINVVVFKDSFTSDLNRTITDIHINNIFKDGIDDDGKGTIKYSMPKIAVYFHSVKKSVHGTFIGTSIDKKSWQWLCCHICSGRLSRGHLLMKSFILRSDE